MKQAIPGQNITVACPSDQPRIQTVCGVFSRREDAFAFAARRSAKKEKRPLVFQKPPLFVASLQGGGLHMPPFSPMDEGGLGLFRRAFVFFHFLGGTTL